MRATRAPATPTSASARSAASRSPSALAKRFSEPGLRLSPSVAAAFSITQTLRLRGSAGQGFRLPTYVDLDYSDPTTVGNPNLKPESSWSYEGGLDWNPGARLQFTAVGFRLNETNVIDYAKLLPLTPAEKWQAINVPSLDLSGVETSLRIRLAPTQQIQLGYTAAHSGNVAPAYLSEYAYNYAAQNAIFSWTGQWPGRLHQVAANTQVNVVQKTGQTAYPLWDLSLSRNTGGLRPYLRLLNLANTGYQEIPQVPMQGRTIMGGVELILSRR